jgi:predicted transcriptional regulator
VDKAVLAAVLRAVKANPGVGVRELARLMGRPPMTVSVSLRELSASGRLVVQQRGVHRLHFLPDQPRLERVSASSAPILELIRGQGPMRLMNVRAAFPNVPRTTVGHRLDQLVKRGLLVKQREGRAVWYVART